MCKINEATVLDNHAVILGGEITCDGYYTACNIGAITHAHEDHLVDFESLIGCTKTVFMTPITKELIVAIKGNHLKKRDNLVEIDLNEEVKINGGKITFFHSGHMLGSAQILYEDPSGKRIVYTGDINIGTLPIPSDVLVIDSSVGTEEYNFNPDNVEYARRELVTRVNKLLDKGVSVHIKAPRGTLHVAMNILRTAGNRLPFITDKTNLRIAEIYEKHGDTIFPIFKRDSEEEIRLKEGGETMINFHPLTEKVPENDNSKIIAIFNWGKNTPYTTNSIFLPNHPDLGTLLDYVKESDPKIVITDNVRGQGLQLAEIIQKKLKITAIACPQ